MLLRKRGKDITQWIKDGENALLVTGARQTGKTFLIQKFLEQEKCDYVEFYLIKQSEATGFPRPLESKNRMISTGTIT